MFVNKKVFFRHLKELKISLNKGRPITKARIEAVDDPRNAITHAVAMECLCKGRNPALLANVDSTQFLYDQSNGGRILVASKADEQRYLHESHTGLFVKYISIYFANGYAAPPVLLCANDNIEEGTYICETVQLLSHSTDPHAFGYLVWTKTRAGNVAFFKWLFLTVIFPAIESQRSSCGFDENSETYMDDSYAVFTLDGEQQQIMACSDTDVSAVSLSSRTRLLKLCASCSLIHQLCDLCPIYRNSKKDMQHIAALDYENTSLKRNIETSLSLHNETLNLSAEEKQKVVKALLKVIGVLKKNVTFNNIVNGAKKAGMLGSSDNWSETVRMQIFAASTHTFTAVEWQIIESHWDELTQFFLDNGLITDEYMDSLGIPRGQYDVSHVNREELAEFRWRITCLNHDAIHESISARRAEKHAREEQLRVAQEQRERINSAKVNIKPILDESENICKHAATVKLTLTNNALAAKSKHIEAKRLNLRSRRLPIIKTLRETAEDALNAGKQFYSEICEKLKSIKDYFRCGEVDSAEQAKVDIAGLAISIENISINTMNIQQLIAFELENLSPA